MKRTVAALILSATLVIAFAKIASSEHYLIQQADKNNEQLEIWALDHDIWKRDNNLWNAAENKFIDGLPDIQLSQYAEMKDSKNKAKTLMLSRKIRASIDEDRQRRLDYLLKSQKELASRKHALKERGLRLFKQREEIREQMRAEILNMQTRESIESSTDRVLQQQRINRILDSLSPKPNK